MKRAIFVGLSLVLGANAAYAALQAQAPRGSQPPVQIPVPGRLNEVCVLPKHFDGGLYSDYDAEQEQALCKLNFHENAPICPKLNSTNPGIDVYLLPEGTTVEKFEASGCATPKGKKFAKYKLSTSCSYTPSILGYYHMSRILGDVAQVPQSVLRTVDLPKHIEIGKKALAVTKAGSLIRQTWTGLMSNLTAGINAKKRDVLLTDDFKQSYGALIKNPSKEAFYDEFFNGGADGPSRAANFREKNAVMKLLNSATPASSLVGRDFTQANVQKLVQMKDASEMIILDTLMNQQDRFGNIHAIEVFKFVDAADGKVKTEYKLTDEEIAKLRAVKVKQMILKDNDCGVAKDNVAVKAALASRIKHLDPEVYARLQKLDAEADQDAVKNFFTQELVFTATDYKSVRANLKTLAAQLRKACNDKVLKLDLDLDSHFGKAAPKNVSCQ